MKAFKKAIGLAMPVMMAMLFETAVLSGCEKEENSDSHSYIVTGNASGSAVVPPVAGDASGTFSGTYDPESMVLEYTTNWSNLTGTPISGGLYTGASGAAGVAIGAPWTIGVEWTTTGTYSGTATLSLEQANDLINGKMYWTMGTAANTGGEIRGQLSATR